MSLIESIFQEYGLAVPERDAPRQPAHSDERSVFKTRRVGLITGSRFGRVNFDRSGKGFSQGTRTFFDELLAEWATGKPTPSTADNAKSIQWGRQYEPVAVELYEKQKRVTVKHKGDDQQFVRLPGSKLIGGTPDGLVGKNGVLEVKCPYTFKNHLRTVRDQCVPDEYEDQVWGHLLLTGRQWCDFVSYHPEAEHVPKLVIVRIERDENKIRALRARLLAAEKQVLDDLARLGINHRQLMQQRSALLKKLKAK